MENPVEYLKDYLKKHQVKPSIIRLIVLDYLLSRRTHPTAEEVYRALLSQLPTASRASVYNTLELFRQREIVQALPREGRETRYDIDDSFHGHFECEACGKIYDFHLDPDKMDLRELGGFVVKARAIYCRGLCPQCRPDQ
ncbi:MAG: Fur family transcriptional regulator [Candidatus Caldatribacteriaceae bacterium]